MKYLFLISTIFLGFQSQASSDGCLHKFQKLDLCARISWKGEPSPNKINALQLTITGTKREHYQELIPSINLWMPSMGHGSAPVVLKKTDEFIFESRRVIFPMAGNWEINISVQADDGSEKIVDTVTVPIIVND